MTPKIRLWYCKSLKGTGKPIVVQDLEKKETYTTDNISFDNVNIRMNFNNAVGPAKASGATTILEIWR